MKIEQEASLKDYNTFGIEAQADWLISYDSLEDLETLVRDEYFQECRCLHIGAGSNLLFLTNYHGIILRSLITSLEVVQEDDTMIRLKLGAGWVWDDVVDYAVSHGYYGIENLSLIPGQLGAAAIQNIGAYGVEIEQVICQVYTMHRRTGECRIFDRAECLYAYRDSLFKRPEMADYIVTHVCLELSKRPRYTLSYAGLEQTLLAKGVELSLEEVRRTIIEIRSSKLPDPSALGNAGSFFMNPIVETEVYQRISQEYPNMPAYPIEGGRVKLAAGWLIEHSGMKGYRQGKVGVYDRQALVLVNHGGATGQDIANLAIEVQEAVRRQFGVELHPEVRYIS